MELSSATHNIQPAKILSAGENKDMINLKLIMVSGRTKEFLFAQTTTAGEVAHYVFDHWPTEWADEKVESAAMLKLIYHGRFLHGSVTLSALHLPLGRTTVMHLVARENLPEQSSADNPKKSKSGCCSCCCSIS